MRFDFIGAMSYAQPIDWEVWNFACSEMAKCSPVVDNDFYTLCSIVVSEGLDLDLNHDVDEHNAVDVYLHLIRNIV